MNIESVSYNFNNGLLARDVNFQCTIFHNYMSLTIMYRGLFLFDVSFAIIAVQETFPGEQGKHKTLAQESCS